jgi:hypothetical protein
MPLRISGFRTVCSFSSQSFEYHSISLVLVSEVKSKNLNMLTTRSYLRVTNIFRDHPCLIAG